MIFRRFGEVFRSHLRANLAAEGFSPRDQERLPDGGPDVFGKATDRGVLGSMNDHVRTSKFMIAYEEDLGPIDFVRLGHHMNEAPMRRIATQHATGALRAVFAAGAA